MRFSHCARTETVAGSNRTWQKDLGGKKVLVTGGGGFIGSHLTRRLVDLGAEVAVLTKYESIVDNVRLAALWDNILPIEGDLRNLDSLRSLVDFAPEVIFHLAAYNHVGGSFRHYSEALECNGNGTANLLNAYQDYERFVYISSSEVYGAQTVPFIETKNPPTGVALRDWKIYGRSFTAG